MKLEKLYWRDVKADFFKLNQELASIIDKLNPPDDCFFYKAVYPYGDLILQKGVFQLPSFNGRKHRLADPEVPDEIKKEIGYNQGNYPALLVLDHPIELFITINNISIPYFLLRPGDIMGLGYVMKDAPSNELQLSNHGNSVWSMSSGARSTFLLPKICYSSSHKRLEKKLNVVMKKPLEIFDHWEVFRVISSKLGSDWNSTVLFFSKNWFKYAHTPEWVTFKLYMYQTYTHKLRNYWNNLMSINIGLTQIHLEENLKPTLRIIDILRNIFAVANGDSLGFQPAIDDSLLPASIIQDAYINLYKLPDYYPTIMQPAYYSALDKKPVYTSVNMMSIDNLYDVLKVHSDAQLMEEVRYTYQKYAEVLRSDKASVDSDATYLSEVAKNRNVEFFHYLRYKDNPRYSEIDLIDVKEIPRLDPRFITDKYPNNQELAHAGTFIKACIKISPK
ncbi:MAG: hypothetical protein K0R66_318 [Gammaproteobacteria bacterium]|nr:hypothetical protein [Gammaproteobacteria bacterium]